MNILQANIKTSGLNRNIFFPGVLILALFTILSFSQENKKLSHFNQVKLEKANNYFKASEYYNACKLYEEILLKSGNDTSIICKIGDSYRLMYDFINAEHYYRMAIQGNEETISPIYLFYFGQVLTTNKKYDEALSFFREYYKRVSNDKRVLENIRSLENISELFYDTTFYITAPMEINSESSEFCATYYNNGILFLSDKSSVRNGFFSWYYTIPDNSGDYHTAEKISLHPNVEYNEGPASFFENYSKMIYSKNYFEGKLDKNAMNEIPLQLFLAHKNNENQWEDIGILPFVNKAYTYSHPSISKDGRTLYFSSNMAGGQGKTDLYVTHYDGQTWSTPVNLGININTSSDEMFPFIFNDSILFFSSDGHGGLGGLDIFMINLNDIENIRNMGAPLNSSGDDYGIVFRDNGLTGFFSSNRDGGKGVDDIYSFKQIRISISIKIIDEQTKLPVPGAEIYLDNNSNIPIGITGLDGKCTLLIPVNDIMQVKIKKDNYESKLFTFEELNGITLSLSEIPIKTEEPEQILLTDENNQVINEPINVVYKVQILASRRSAGKKELKAKYHGNMEIYKFNEDNWHKYFIGSFSTYEDAKKCLYDSKVGDAFIIAYIEGKKVNIVIAKESTNETSIEPPNRADLKNK